MLLDVLTWDKDKQEYLPQKKPKLVPSCSKPRLMAWWSRSQTSEHVDTARAAVQELLLLNHPVDCPICDQAGECRLQDYWLEHSGTKKRMRDEPIHKPKAVVFGPTIVYDAERCIVCTRCVRVSEELAKDPVLSVRERGNLNEIVVAPGSAARSPVYADDRVRVPRGRADLDRLPLQGSRLVPALHAHRLHGLRHGLQLVHGFRPAQSKGVPLPSAREPGREQVLDVR